MLAVRWVSEILGTPPGLSPCGGVALLAALSNRLARLRSLSSSSNKRGSSEPIGTTIFAGRGKPQYARIG